MKLLYVLSALVAISSAQLSPNAPPKVRTCTVTPSLNSAIDDAPAIVAAFTKCRKDGIVKFLNQTYFINSVMTTTGLSNVDVELRGTLQVSSFLPSSMEYANDARWSGNTSYWLKNSLPVGYQNQSTAWVFGGNNIDFKGYGYGTLYGQGGIWYALKLGSNYPRRPHQITITNTTNSLFEDLRFIQAPMWTMTVIHSKNVVLENIYVNNTGSSGGGSSNTDGANTIYADNIVFNKWEVYNGDDSISVKANSTNVVISNSIFHTGLGVAFGSIGQYLNAFETIENISVTNVSFDKTLHAAYIKTWTGQQVGYPPNGGGGGLGYMKNITVSNLKVSALRGPPIQIGQCTTFSGVVGNCSSSAFQIEQFAVKNMTGSIAANPIARLQCSAVAPCGDITLADFDLRLVGGGAASGYRCTGPVTNPVGFSC